MLPAPYCLTQEVHWAAECWVLCGLEDRLDALLPALAQAGAGPECLKAVLTAHNRSWNVLRLHQELLRERQAMEGRE